MKSLLVVLALLFSLQVSAQVDADIDQLLQHPFVMAQFKKERKLKILSRPFVTHGYMLFKPGKGLIWKTTSPIDDTILIRGNEIRSLNENAQGAAISQSSPIMISASEMFLAIMSRDKNRILAIFEYEKMPAQDGNARYRLTPRDEKLANIISVITLSGRDRVEDIDIQEKSGDSTTIHLLNETFDVDRLDAAQRALYERI